MQPNGCERGRHLPPRRPVGGDASEGRLGLAMPCWHYLQRPDHDDPQYQQRRSTHRKCQREQASTLSRRTGNDFSQSTAALLTPAPFPACPVDTPPARLLLALAPAPSASPLLAIRTLMSTRAGGDSALTTSPSTRCATDSRQCSMPGGTPAHTTGRFVSSRPPNTTLAEDGPGCHDNPIATRALMSMT